MRRLSRQPLQKYKGMQTSGGGQTQIAGCTRFHRTGNAVYSYKAGTVPEKQRVVILRVR